MSRSLLTRRTLRPEFFALLIAAHAGTARSAPGQPLRVQISSPSAGIVDADFTVELEARVSDPRVRTALLAVNGAVYEVPVRGGRITQTFVAVPGNNRVGVVVQRGGSVARDALTFFLRGEPAELLVLLTWPARGEIIDLWVREPDGETCKWDHRQTRSKGRLLDFSEDAIGFGSQAYVLGAVRPGTYRIKVHYWGAWGRDDDRNIAAYDEMISRLDKLTRDAAKPIDPAAARKLDTERTALLGRLDRWAAPAAPQTPVQAEAVLFPGTPHERRFRFPVIVHRTGQLLSRDDHDRQRAAVARLDRRGCAATHGATSAARAARRAAPAVG